MTPTTLRLDPKQRERLRQLAKDTEATTGIKTAPSSLIRRAVADLLDRSDANGGLPPIGKPELTPPALT